MMTRDEQFESWWNNSGKSYDPDTSDVPWYDKRKALAREAFMHALSRNQPAIVGYLEAQSTVGRISVICCPMCGSVRMHH